MGIESKDHAERLEDIEAEPDFAFKIRTGRDMAHSLTIYADGRIDLSPGFEMGPEITLINRIPILQAEAASRRKGFRSQASELRAIVGPLASLPDRLNAEMAYWIEEMKKEISQIIRPALLPCAPEQFLRMTEFQQRPYQPGPGVVAPERQDLTKDEKETRFILAADAAIDFYEGVGQSLPRDLLSMVKEVLGAVDEFEEKRRPASGIGRRGA
jgi:hypothetical protein